MSINQETAMFWKVEPLSPSGTTSIDLDEEWLSFDEKPAVLEDNGQESVLFEEPLTRAQVASKYLEELEINWIKEESFADWLEEKIDLPFLEDLPAPECGQNRAIVYPNIPKQQQHQQPQVITASQIDATQSLLREFETVLGDVEAIHQIGTVSTLTPPQSPPPIATLKQQPAVQHHLLVALQPLHHQGQATFVYNQPLQQHHEETIVVPSALAYSQHQQQQVSDVYTVSSLPLASEQYEQQIAAAEHWSAENLSLVPLVHDSDVANELAQVDEYVRSCAEEATAAGGSSSYTSDPPSPCTSSNGSCVSSEDSSTDDPDWSIESSNTSTNNSNTRRASTSTGRTGRRSSNKPYSRPNVEDKRVRKKEQNKNAATRYRQKKKQEVKKIIGEEQQLVDKNEKLHVKVNDLQREIGYLKGLMRDLFKAKGLIK